MISLRTKPVGRVRPSVAELQHALKIILAHTWGQLCFSVIQSSSSLNYKSLSLIPMASRMANVTIWVILTSCVPLWKLDSYHPYVSARAITMLFPPVMFTKCCQRQGNKFIVKAKCVNSLSVVKVLMVLYKLKTISACDLERILIQSMYVC